MTTCHPGRSGGDAVKGLAKYGNRLHHGLMAKYVDTSPSLRRKGGYSPMSVVMLTGIVRISKFTEVFQTLMNVKGRIRVCMKTT